MKNKLTLKIIYIIIAIIIIFFTDLRDSKINKAVDGEQTKITEDTKIADIVVSESTQEIINETIEATEGGEDISTIETIEGSEYEEQNITDEGVLESDAVIEQENISYNGDKSGEGVSLLGSYQGLTYYSQADSRWANVMYSSIGNTSQTMKNSACGPTSAAIIVSSSKGAILPTTMAQLFIDNGYRTVDNGTSWNAFPFIADYFKFSEYNTTSSFNKAMEYLGQKDIKGNSKYYIICSCGSGLFTKNGHYIVLFSLDGETIQVYDPYLYEGKFETTSRKNARALVSGNTVYVSKSSFEEYSNYKNFWIFSNDNGNENTVTASDSTTVSYTRYVATQSSNLNVRGSASTNANVIGSLPKGTAVTVTEVNVNWSKISNPVGWVNNSYLSSSLVTLYSNSTKKTITGYTTGKYKVTKVSKSSYLNVRIGAGTKYSAKTWKQLSTNAIQQNSKLGNRYCNGYMNGVICTVTRVSGNWGKTASGWICLDYCTKAT